MKRSSTSEPQPASKKKKTEIHSNLVLKKNSVNEVKPKFGKKSSPNKQNGKATKSKKLKGNSMKQISTLKPTAITTSQSGAKLAAIKVGGKKPLKSKFGKTDLKKNKELLKKQGKKVVTELPSNLIGKDGKPEWGKVKVEKKKLKENRKVQRSGADQYQLSVKAKSVWEKLRQRNHTAEKKESLVNDLFLLLKGQIPNVVHSHDMTRVVQWMLKLGSAAVRTAVCEELSANTVSFLQSKFACHCVKRALRYGSKTDRNHLIESCNGKFLKLLGYSYAWPVVEMMYSMFASAEQRRRMHQEMYGEMHVLLPPEVSAIQNVPDNLRPAILAAAKTNLTKLLAKKQLLKSTLVQSVLIDLLNSCSEQDRTEILELIHGDIVDLLTTKEGSRVALLTVWHGTNKMKKVIVKSLKGRVKEISSSEAGHMLLMALFDCIDDTVLVKKALIPELLNEAEELAKNELGRKVILYLVAHRDPAFFHPQQMELLAKGDSISSRKKDAKLREQEMLEAVSDSLLEKIADDPAIWFGESSVTMVALAVLKSGKGDALQKTLDQVISYILDPNSLVEVGGRQFHVIEHSATQLVFKKLLQLDQTDPARTQEPFAMMIASKLTAESLNHILQFNRGCFLLVLLFESKNEKVCKILQSKITESMKAFLKQQETTGSKILLKKLAE